MTARKEQRTAKLISLIAERQRADVAELAADLGVSQVTIRKDLDELEKKGFIRREHGSAHINDTDNVAGRLTFHYDEKRKIAVKAAEFIHNGDTVMIESGSCCALLARVIADTLSDVTIITNSVFIAEYIRDSRNVSVILLGGIYQRDSQCLIGPMIRDTAGNYNVKYLFAGTDGWSERTGFTNRDPLRVQAVRDMAHSAENLVILTESGKFGTPGTIPMNIPKQPRCVITDNDLHSDIRDVLTGNGIQIITV